MNDYEVCNESYTVRTPRTPASWAMPLFNDNYFSFVNQLLQGNSYLLERETYKKQLIMTGDRQFWIKDRKSGQVWKVNDSLATEEYCVTYFANRIELERSLGGIRVTICIFVPVEGKEEYWKVTLTNESSEPRELSLFSYVGFGGEIGMGGVCKEINGVLVKHIYPFHHIYTDKEKCDSYYQRHYFMSSVEPDSCDMSCYQFYGGYLKDSVPQAVLLDKCSNRFGEVEDFCGAMQHILMLESNDTKEICFSVGITVTEEEIVKISQKFSRDLVNQELSNSTAYWDKICNSSTITTPNSEFSRFMNVWVKKQIVFLTRTNRMESYCPIRNQLQDAMGYALLEPKEAKKFMYDVFSLQRSDGYIKQWRSTRNEPAKGLMLLNHCDGPIWITLCGCILVSQLGEPGVLNEIIPFLDYKEGTLLEHMIMAVRYMNKDVGQHGVCLMHDGDWTDPVNGIGRDGKGESAWASMGLMLIAKWLKDLCEQTGNTEYIHELDEIWTATDQIVNSVLWEDDRYIGGFDDKGVPFADKNDENRVLLNVQTWALLSGAARGERAKKVQNTIKSISGELGPYTIYPGFTEWNPQWGRVSLKKNGTTENGAVYCHAAMFKAFSDAILNDGDGMYDTILRATPFNPDNPVEKNRQLPLYVPNYYYSLKGSANYGRSSQAYGTGSASWMYITVIEELFGLKATVNGLTLQPHIPKDWDNVTCIRRFKKAVYKVIYTRSTTGITINGKDFTETILPYEDNATYEIIYGLNERFAQNS